MSDTKKTTEYEDLIRLDFDLRMNGTTTPHLKKTVAKWSTRNKQAALNTIKAAEPLIYSYNPAPAVNNTKPPYHVVHKSTIISVLQRLESTFMHWKTIINRFIATKISKKVPFHTVEKFHFINVLNNLYNKRRK